MPAALDSPPPAPSKATGASSPGFFPERPESLEATGLPLAEIEALVTERFANVDRPLRFCHPRDLLLQVKRRADFEGLPPVATAEAFAVAVRNYFADL